MYKYLSFFLAVLFVQAPGYAADNPDAQFTVEKVQFHNRLNNNLVGNLHLPKDFSPDKKYTAIVVGHPFGAVKEQAAKTYAEDLAKRGYVALTYDASYTGESGGEPRQAVSPDADVEDVSAAVDYLGTRPYVDREKIGALGVCGSGAFFVNAAALDPRIKAVATVSMYDMGRFRRNGMNDVMTKEDRRKTLADIAKQRWAEYEGAEPKINFGTPATLPENPSPVQIDFFNFYRNPERGYHPNYKGTRWTSDQALMNFYPFQMIQEISPRPILFIVGDKAHSRYFSDDAYKMAAEPKELYVVKDATHVDLYDQKDKIPFDKIDTFFKDNLKKE